MTKPGTHTPIDDEEAMEIVRRILAKHPEGVRETANTLRWHQFINRVFDEDRGVGVTDAQSKMLDQGVMTTYEAIPELGIEPWVRYTPTSTYTTWRDATTGRFVSATEVGQRLFAM